MSETINNIIRFNYSVDPTTLMSNSWITNNTDTTQNTVTGVGGETIIHYWRDVTFTITGKGSASGVFRIEVNENGVPISPYNYESISGDEITTLNYDVSTDALAFVANENAGGSFENFSVATENTDYDNGHGTVSSYTSSTTTETVYDHYEVELYVNSDVTTFPNNLFSTGCLGDINITSIEFDTYSVTSIEGGIKSSGAFSGCYNLTSIFLPDNLEYIGNFVFQLCGISSIILPSTLNEIGEAGLNVSNLSITSLATVPPTIHSKSITNSSTLTIHETALQSYINSDWADYVTSIDTIETPTYDNVLKFNYSEDPTTFLNNLWVNSCTDTTQNTVVPQGGTHEETVERNWRTITFSFGEKPTHSGVFRIEVDDNGVPVQPYNFENISGDEIADVVYAEGGPRTDDSLTAYINEKISLTMSPFVSATPSTQYDGWIFTESTESETIIVTDYYTVTLYVNSLIDTFETTMFTEDTNLLTIDFEYDVTFIGDSAFNACTSLTDVTLNTPVPPTLGDDVFKNVNATLYVPFPSLNIYRQEMGDIFPVIKPIKLPAKSYGFNLTGMKNVDYKQQGVIILRN